MDYLAGLGTATLPVIRLSSSHGLKVLRRREAALLAARLSRFRGLSSTAGWLESVEPVISCAASLLTGSPLLLPMLPSRSLSTVRIPPRPATPPPNDAGLEEATVGA